MNVLQIRHLASAAIFFGALASFATAADEALVTAVFSRVHDGCSHHKNPARPASWPNGAVPPH